jgi:outer membrane usher protein
VEGGASVLTDFGLYTADAARVNGNELYRLGMSGGIALLDGSAYMTRRIDESFAVIKVPGYPNLGLYRNNLLIGHTDADGEALITNLLPYEPNYISLEVTDLPIDASPESLKIDAVPRLRSGTLVRFNVQASSGAVITMVQENGDPVPMGATVTKDGSTEEFPVGQRGEVYVTGLTDAIKLTAKWRNLSCRIETALPGDGQPLPKIGPIPCKK